MKSVVIIGGGHFGLSLAAYFGEKRIKVTLLEESNSLMSRASYHNQARVHNGYHYPRSVLTALRSKESFPKFVADFHEAIVRDFDKYYLVAGPLSKVTSNQFYRFCQRVGAEIKEAPDFHGFCNKSLIDGCFKVKEYAFDAKILRDILLKRIDGLPVKIKYLCRAEKVSLLENGQINLDYYDTNNHEQIIADHVFNCTYSRLNYVPMKSKLQLIPLKHEVTEMCLVQVPEILQNKGITVMCGPFFSVMPFPSVKFGDNYLHSFSHVRYTPHYEWHENEESNYSDPYIKLNNDLKNSAWNYMIKDAIRYIPILEHCEYIDSLWEVKTVLPRSEQDDSRPILCKFNHGIVGFHSIMGGKIDNIYDAIKAIDLNLHL